MAIALNAQCSITASTNASVLTCGTAPLNACNGVLNIGNGVTSITLSMDATLDLTCLGSVQVVLNKASIDFSPGNNRLYLAEGSSLIFMNGGQLIGGSCNASERIYVGTNLLASCNGGAGADESFTSINSLGGTGNLISNSPICNGNTINLFATPPPNFGPYTYSWSGPGLSATAFLSSPNYSLTAVGGSASGGVYQVKMKSSIGTTATAETTVIVNTGASTSAPTVIVTQPSCSVSTGAINITAPMGVGMKYSINGITYTNTTGVFNLLSPGVYSVTAKNSSGCVSSITSVTINPQPSTPIQPTLGSPIQPTCSVETGSFTITNYNAAYTYATSPLLGVTISGANVTAPTGTYTVEATLGSCISIASSSVIINAQPSTPAQPTLSSPTQTTCSVATGNFTITNYNALYTYAISPSLGTTISGASVTAPTGSYTITATLGTCTSVASPNITISQLSTTWNGSFWSNGIPTSEINIIFNGNYSSSSDLEGCSCKVISGNVEIESGNTLTLTNDLTVIGGSFKIGNDASLVQINDNAINSGNIRMKRTSRPMYRWDYVYHGSPVANDVISQIPSQYDLRYKYVTNKTITGTWTPITTSTVGEGFITRVRNIAPFNTTPTSIDFNYVGVPNNGEIPVYGTTYDGGLTTAYGNSKLLANPYPCALDAKLFLDDPNNKLFVGGTIYLWTSNTYYIGTGPYSQADYASWNKTGSTGGLPPPGLTPDGKIASGQGFMVQMIADGTLNFKNYMRISGYNNNFFRLSNHAIEAPENHRIWLNITNENSFRQTLIGYVDGATNGEDRSYDGMTLSNSKIDLYSLLNKKELTIQGRALPFDVNDSVDLGYKTSVAGKLTIAIDHVDGLFLENQEIYLEDKILNIIHDLKQSPYEFTSDIGTFNNRFVLRYANSTLGTDNPNSKISSTALIFNKKIMVHAAKKIKKIEIYDMTGKLIKEYTPKMSVQFFEDDFSFAQGIYLAKVRFENDSISTQKLTNNN